jgi:hypothetical protein
MPAGRKIAVYRREYCLTLDEKKKTSGKERGDGLIDEAAKWMEQFTEPEKLDSTLLFETKFLGVFATLRKATTSFFMSVRLH